VNQTFRIGPAAIATMSMYNNDVHQFSP
jgi:hypothetical protein